MSDGPQVEIKVKPHGNSKGSIFLDHFFQHLRKQKDCIKTLSKEAKPKEVVTKITKEQGGEVEARGSGFLPRNRQQVPNF